MTIPTQTYEDIYDRYMSAINWMNEIGIEQSKGRTSHYEKIIKYCKNSYHNATADEAKEMFPDFVNSMYEVFDFIKIHQAFNGQSIDQLKFLVEKLQNGVNGPINMIDETPDSTKARNFLFEVIVAARINCPSQGFETILDAKSDTGVRFDRNKIWIECKRVTNTNKIESNIRKASSQLENILISKVGSGHRGVVALDISKILNNGDEIFKTQNDQQLMSSTAFIMDEFIREYAQLWEGVYERRNKKIIGTIVRFSFMATSESRNLLVHTSEWALNPRVGVSQSDEQNLRRVVSVLKL